jgi:hypothetical protein
MYDKDLVLDILGQIIEAVEIAKNGVPLPITG